MKNAIQLEPVTFENFRGVEYNVDQPADLLEQKFKEAFPRALRTGWGLKDYEIVKDKVGCYELRQNVSILSYQTAEPKSLLIIRTKLIVRDMAYASSKEMYKKVVDFEAKTLKVFKELGSIKDEKDN